MKKHIAKKATAVKILNMYLKELEEENKKQADLLTEYSCSNEAIKRIKAGEDVREVFKDYGWKTNKLDKENKQLKEKLKITFDYMKPLKKLWDDDNVWDDILDKKQHDPDINKCPGCGGYADNGFDKCMPPSPYYCTKCEKKLKKKFNDFC